MIKKEQNMVDSEREGEKKENIITFLELYPKNEWNLFTLVNFFLRSSFPFITKLGH